VSSSELDPHDVLGSSGDYPRFVSFFQDRIREAGVDAVLHDWVPVLIPGLAASAFHAMIRLAYAIEGGLEDEIALALAYWASEYAPLPLALEPGEGSLEQIAGRLRAKLADHVFKPGIIIDRMLEIAWDQALAGAVVQPAAAPSLRDIARFALQAYAEREDFTLLHIVTGCHAFRIVQRYANDKALARRYLWQAALAAWLTVVAVPAGRKQEPVQESGAGAGWRRTRRGRDRGARGAVERRPCHQTLPFRAVRIPGIRRPRLPAGGRPQAGT
jgi:hypothetical protein